ncbi:MAG: helix-turn-helix domain-containing protein [Steroidobacteraceae bacterium]
MSCVTLVVHEDNPQAQTRPIPLLARVRPLSAIRSEDRISHPLIRPASSTVHVCNTCLPDLPRADRRLQIGPLPTRIAQLIELKFAVKLVPSSVWRLLGRLGWGVQRPTGVARERDERAVRTWKAKR